MTPTVIAIAFIVSICLVIAVTSWAHRVNRRTQEQRRRLWQSERDEHE